MTFTQRHRESHWSESKLEGTGWRPGEIARFEQDARWLPTVLLIWAVSQWARNLSVSQSLPGIFFFHGTSKMDVWQDRQDVLFFSVWFFLKNITTLFIKDDKNLQKKLELWDYFALSMWKLKHHIYVTLPWRIKEWGMEGLCCTCLFYVHRLLFGRGGLIPRKKESFLWGYYLSSSQSSCI